MRKRSPVTACTGKKSAKKSGKKIAKSPAGGGPWKRQRKAGKTGDGFRIRSQQFRQIKARYLDPDPLNWRTHGPEQVAALQSLLSEIGFVGSLLVRPKPGTRTRFLVIDGHARLEEFAADDEIPCCVVDITEADARKLLAAYDPITAQAGADRQLYEELISGIDYEIDGGALEALIAGTLADIPDPSADVEPGEETENPRGGKGHDLAIMTSSKSTEWYTPADLIDDVIKVMGAIDLDPCSNSHDAPNVPAGNHYTQDDDGLSKRWRGRVFLNPPYSGSTTATWIEKIKTEFEDGKVTGAVVLVAARTNTVWFNSLRHYPRCFVRGNLSFISGDDGTSDGAAPFPVAVFYLGSKGGRFRAVFRDRGDIFVLDEN